MGIAPISRAQTFRLLYQFKSGRDGKVPYGTLVLDKAGNLYGTTSEGGAYGGGMIFKLTPKKGWPTLYISKIPGADN